MRFEWNEQKAAQNLTKHKVPFVFAARVFLDPYRLDAEDTRQDYGEERRLTLGRIEWRLYAVAYTMRGEIVRLISARKPTGANKGDFMKRYRLEPKKPRRLTPEEQERLDKARIDYSDIPALGDEFFAKAKQAWPPAKQQVTIRVDSDVLEWLRTHGRGYQTRINRILRAAMESQTTAQPARRRPSARSTSNKTRGGPKRP